MSEKIFNYFINYGSDYLLALCQHLWISLLSVTLAFAAGFAAGTASAGNEKAYRFVTTVFNTIRIIPSLAVLILLIPVMGTGVKPAVTALVFLAVPPVLINTALAFHSIPASVLEAADGMGMSAGQEFFQVKLPLAAPFLFTGLRTASVEVIASATLAAYIGGGGLGSIIFTGLGLNRTDLLLIGGVSVALLALLVSACINAASKRIVKWQN